MEEKSTSLRRRKNIPVASGVVKESIQILDRNTVNKDEKRLGCVQYVTYPSVKCQDTTGRAAFISSTNQRHCLTLIVRRHKAYK
jgi:hypothetical protein